MPHYIALVHKDQTSAFGVQLPDVPGCFSAADEMDDLVANAMEALSLWAEDETLPAPRSIDALKKDKTIGRELAEGAFQVSVPFVENDTRVVSANISLERGVLRHCAPFRPLTLLACARLLLMQRPCSGPILSEPWF